MQQTYHDWVAIYCWIEKSWILWVHAENWYHLLFQLKKSLILKIKECTNIKEANKLIRLLLINKEDVVNEDDDLINFFISINVSDKNYVHDK